MATENNDHEKNSKLRYEGINNKYKGWLKTAYVTLIIGGILFLAITIHYLVTNGFSYEDKNNLSAFAALLGAVVGIFITVSSIFFLIYNLRIQNESLRINIEDVELTLKEIQTSNDNFLKQKQENTFFNLLEHHNKLTHNFGVESLVKLHTETKNKLKSYHYSLRNKLFNDFLLTENNPERIYNNDPKITPIIQNIVHIVNYIDNTLNGEQFYKDTLFHTLSECEQFYIGMLAANKLISMQDIPYKGFSRYYYKSTDYINFIENGVFPVLEIKQVAEKNNSADFTLPGDSINIIENLFRYDLRVTRKYNGNRVFYKGFFLTIEYSQSRITIEQLGENIELDLNSNAIISLLNEHALSFVKSLDIKGIRNQAFINFMVEFKFNAQTSYFNEYYEQFTINHHFALGLNKQDQNSVRAWITNR